MKKNHVIEDKALEYIANGIDRGLRYLAYNTSRYFLERKDMQLFRHYSDANDFVKGQHKPEQAFAVIEAKSIREVLRQLPYNTHTQLEQRVEISVNPKNLDKLMHQLRERGFGEELRMPLHAAMLKGEPVFVLTYLPPFDKQTQVTLHFNQPEKDKPYSWEQFTMVGRSSLFPHAEHQRFEIGKDQPSFTVSEAYNLMNNRAVYKEAPNVDKDIRQSSPHQKVWMQLNFKETDAKGNYLLKQYGPGFDLEVALSRYSIRELSDPTQKIILMQSLEEGNRHAVVLGKTNVFIEAAPQFKSLNFYDEIQQRIRPDQVKAIGSTLEIAQHSTQNDILKNERLSQMGGKHQSHRQSM